MKHLVMLMCAFLLFSVNHAEARKYNHGHHGVNKHHSRSYGYNSKPRKWCGWYMRQLHGGGPEYNVARNWAKRGRATGPQVGAIVVWRHHVGKIVGRAANGWLVLSGNDSNRVRTRPRSVSGAIAFRML